MSEKTIFPTEMWIVRYPDFPGRCYAYPNAEACKEMHPDAEAHRYVIAMDKPHDGKKIHMAMGTSSATTVCGRWKSMAECVPFSQKEKVTCLVCLSHYDSKEPEGYDYRKDSK